MQLASVHSMVGALISIRSMQLALLPIIQTARVFQLCTTDCHGHESVVLRPTSAAIGTHPECSCNADILMHAGHVWRKLLQSCT